MKTQPLPSSTAAENKAILRTKAFPIRYRTRITMAMMAALLLITWHMAPVSLALSWWIAGIIGIVGGSALRLWASGYLIKNEELACRGPFRYTRNPLYLGSLVIGGGFALLTGRWEALILVAALVLLVFEPTVRDEERTLAARFGETYAAYCRTVPRWGVRLPASPCDGPVPPFRWDLVRFHQEHRHLTVHLVLLAAFVAIHMLR